MTVVVDPPALTNPAWVNIPERDGSQVEQVRLVSASVDRILDPEQLMAVDVLTSIKDGKPAALEGGVVTARQNLKTFVLEDITLTKLVEPGPPVLGVWSAQLFDTAQETFRNFDELFAGYAHLSRRVKKVHRGNGEEEIELKSGSRLKFKARSKSGGRGLTGDFVVLDEAYALEPGHMGALLPTLSTRRRAHVLYGSSAGMSRSAILRALRDRGRASGKGAPAYIEFCAPGSLEEPTCERGKQCRHDVGTAGCSLDDESLWPLANPALGRRISYEYIRAERRALPPEEFARERLGWWDEPDDAVNPVLIEDWVQLKFGLADRPAGVPVFFLDASPGLASASIAVVALHEGRPHLELADHRPGADWLVGRAKELRERYPAARFGSLATGSISALLTRLDNEAGVKPEQLSNQDYGRACGHLQALVSKAGLTQSGDQAFVTALVAAVRRDVGDDLWCWSRRKSGGDIGPIVAGTGALWLLECEPDYDVAESVF